MIKAIIFDFGGVVVRTEDYTPRHAWDERLGLPTGSVERAVHHSDIWIQAQLGRILPKAYWAGVAELLYMRNNNVEELRRDYFSGDRLNYRLVQLIRDLKDANLLILHGGGRLLESSLEAIQDYSMRSDNGAIYWHAPEAGTFDKLRKILEMGKFTIIPSNGPLTISDIKSSLLTGICREDLTYEGYRDCK